MTDLLFPASVRAFLALRENARLTRDDIGVNLIQWTRHSMV